MSDESIESIEFLRAVLALRGLSPRYKSLAFHASMFWSDEEIVERALLAEIPSNELPVRGLLQ